jgi:DNA-directed RNA polymerase specialized sigma24 family protein
VRKEADPIDLGKRGQEVLSSLTDQQWLDLWNRLKLFTNTCYFNVEGEDLIIKAIIAVMEGRRRWYSEKSPFLNFCWIIRSIASNEIASDEFAREKKSIPLACTDEIPADSDQLLISSSTPSHTEIYEQQENDKNFSERLHQSLQGDSLSCRVVDYLIDDPSWKPQKIAKALGEETKEINNTRKRLRRKLRR